MLPGGQFLSLLGTAGSRGSELIEAGPLTVGPGPAADNDRLYVVDAADDRVPTALDCHVPGIAEPEVESVGIPETNRGDFAGRLEDVGAFVGNRCAGGMTLDENHRGRDAHGRFQLPVGDTEEFIPLPDR